MIFLVSGVLLINDLGVASPRVVDPNPTTVENISLSVAAVPTVTYH